MVDLNKYCKYPLRYQNLPLETRTHYDHICSLKSSFGFDWKEQGSKLGLNLVNFPTNFILSIFTPEGLEMLSIFMGVNLTTKSSFNFLLRGISKGVGPEVMETASALALERGALYVNNSILTTVLTSAVEEGSVAAMGLAVTKAVTAALSQLEVVVIIVQTLGALIDAWDPEGFSNELDANAMDAINETFNSEFITRFLETVTIGKDKYGRPIHLSGWPVEYHLDAMLAAEDPNPHKDQNIKMFQYIVEYLDSLEYNSDGQRILHADPNDDTELIDASMFPKLSNQLVMTISDKNTVVANWVKTHWFIILLGVGILVFLLLRRG
jgi:hypothetical protein